jgi:hypothetical protein
MDYAVWSRAYLLWCVADLVRSDPERESERFADYEARAQRLVDDLTSREKPGGGWSYYVTRDVRAAGNATVQAMSFTTSAVVLALLAAEQAGFDVPRAALERGLDTIERAGKGRQTYEYMVFPSGPGKEDPEAIAGDTGRGPVCALALHRGGRASLDAIEDALELFDDTRDTYAKELGKTLMHTGPYGQGSHYLLFDYANAAFAVAALPSGKRTRYRKAVLTEVLRAHTSEGAFLDTVLNGRAYGSAMALLALDALR